MAVAAPERTYAIDPEDQPRPASQEPARGPAALASEPRARRRRDRDADDATDERQVGLGNGYLDAERQPDRDARDRAEQAREETRRSGEPEYARSVKIEEPERGQTTRPITQKPEAVGEAEALKNENAKDDADAAALKEEKPIPEGEEGAEKEDEEEG